MVCSAVEGASSRRRSDAVASTNQNGSSRSSSSGEAHPRPPSLSGHGERRCSKDGLHGALGRRGWSKCELAGRLNGIMYWQESSACQSLGRASLPLENAGISVAVLGHPGFSDGERGRAGCCGIRLLQNYHW